VRDGLRWPLIETIPGVYDWSSFLPMLRAAKETGTQVIWDLCHWGWPDDIEIWSPAFVDRFAAFAHAVAQVVRNETDQVPFYVPVNEISFWAWAGGDLALINPLAIGRGNELKVILGESDDSRYRSSAQVSIRWPGLPTLSRPSMSSHARPNGRTCRGLITTLWRSSRLWT
jgi:hypothetical protein